MSDDGTAMTICAASMHIAGNGSSVGVTPSSQQKQSMPTSTFSTHASRMQNCSVVAHAPTLARAASDLGNAVWGPLMRAGNDKSLFARQVERYADIYTSRLEHLLACADSTRLYPTRCRLLPHDP